MIAQIQEQEAAQDRAVAAMEGDGEGSADVNPGIVAGDNPAPNPQGEGYVEGFDESDPTTWGNPGRNQLCPCGSGKKFKHCHGRLA